MTFVHKYYWRKNDKTGHFLNLYVVLCDNLILVLGKELLTQTTHYFMVLSILLHPDVRWGWGRGGQMWKGEVRCGREK